MISLNTLRNLATYIILGQESHETVVVGIPINIFKQLVSVSKI